MTGMMSRRSQDCLILFALVASGAVLRFWGLFNLGLTHFDEGSYTMAGKWLATLGREGWAIPAGQAPALYPALLGVSFAIFGIQDYAAVGVSAAIGSLTIGLVYLVGQHWFCRRVAVAGTLILSTCEYHLIYSRLALTDATFTLLFWAALTALFYGLETGSRRWSIVGGLLTGLCWNTKYHGFLPLIIVGFWLLLSCLRQRDFDKLRSPQKRSHFTMAAILSLLTYVPWVLLVQFTVGYGSILEGHFSHSLGMGTLDSATPSGLYFYLSRWLGLPTLILASLGFAFVLIEKTRTGLFLVTATLVFTGSTFLYASFPRLVLPIVPALCLLSAYGLHSTTRRLPFLDSKILFALATTSVLAWNLAASAPLLSVHTDSYRQAAHYLQNFRVPIITQLSKNYYFYEMEKSVEMRWQSRDELDALLEKAPSTIIAIDPIIHRLPEYLDWFESHRPYLTRLRCFEVGVYEPVHYQGFDPQQDFRHLPRSVAPTVPGDTKIEVYRFRQPESESVLPRSLPASL